MQITWTHLHIINAKMADITTAKRPAWLLRNEAMMRTRAV